MIRSHLIIAIRNLLRNKIHSAINIGGLALGISCFTAVFLFVENEFSYDRFHDHAESIYRVVKNFVNDDGTRVPDVTTPPALAKALRDELPEVEQVTRFFPNGGRLYLLQSGEKRFYETNVIRADSAFFKVFDFPFLSGEKHSALKGIHSVVLTESTSKKYFGNEDPLNKVIRMNLNNGTDFVVTGVVKDVPQNSHFTFDLLIPFESSRDSTIDQNWNWYSFLTYVKLKDGTNATAFQSNVKRLFKNHQPESTNEYFIQPIVDIHLNSNLKWELAQNGDLLNVRIMMVIGLFVILIAATNYVNLVTAQSAKRAKEIGVRKVTGAPRSLLIRQLLTESIFTVMLSLALSIILTSLLLPLTKSFVGYDLFSLVGQSGYIRLVLPATALLVGVVAGLYPALVLSAFEPLKVLRGGMLSSHQGINLRQGLVVFQFVVATGLIIGSLTIIRQLEFLKQKKLGFDKENILLLPNVRGGISSENVDPDDMVGELRKIPGIAHIARADGILGSDNSANGVSAKKTNSTHVVLNFIRADYEFLPTLDIKLKEGRNFSDQFVSDKDAIILNEAAVAQLGLEKPYLGQQLAWDDSEGKTHDVTIIAIAEDFHFSSFREAIKPFGFILEVGNGSTFFLKMDSQNAGQTIATIGNVWSKYYPEKPFEYSFQDETFSKLYVYESRFQNIFSLFTVLAIFITCLGMFGLVIFLAESKTKEIGIRKVLGASALRIVVLLSKNFVILVIVALAISAPLAYYIMSQWLEEYAYRTSIDWRIFMITGLASIGIALFTIGFHAVRSALTNPVNSLRSE